METRRLQVTLTEDEITQRGRAIAKFDRDRYGLEEAKKAANDEFRAKINACSEAISRLSQVIMTGAEERSVECEEERDYVRKVAVLHRTDTGEVVETRSLGADELQEKLFPKTAGRNPSGAKLPGMDGEQPEQGVPTPDGEGLAF